MNKGLKVMFLVMIVSLVIAGLWNRIPIIKDSVHFILDPTAGNLLNWNINLGMIILVGFISLIITLLQKYTTDQETLKNIKQEQKILQQEMKKYKDHPEKMLELQKKQFEFIPKTMDITMKPLVYTAIPIILFFRWFGDYFSSLQDSGVDYRILGIFQSWIWPYIILSIIFSTIFRKVLKVH
jgi:uncharacterized membrane protein (DUF106 family)